MAENRRGKDSRFYFSRGQMVLLGGAFALASLVIFFLGMFVGQVIEENKLMKKEEPLVKIPVRPSASGAATAPLAQSKEEITYSGAPPKAPAAAEPAAPKESGGKTVKGTVKKGPAAELEAGSRPEKTALLGETSRKAAPAASGDMREQGTVWRAQVNAFPDDRSAQQLVERLRNKGYNAYVTAVESGGKTWYRVSVGKFASRAEAEKIVDTLRSKENFPKAFVASK